MAYKYTKAEYEWKKNNTTHVGFRFNNNTDKEIVDLLNSVPNKQAFIKQLIYEYIESQKKK